MLSHDPPLPRVIMPVAIPETPIRARELRSLVAPDALPPDAVIRAVEIRCDDLYLIADLPHQLALIPHAPEALR